ncbi:P-loop containing nucleoside triphosphate hydrolase protein [Suillus subalutaceus]|uniref:P-loop containing nucleoside triphosphate hydrolase protein n=1 Tax=Suillus subalutaceus TaxID=48586 RepID=UPI001B8698C8|nr:P-loop containing nucleoside triphosphate hydrolase protein [Suillus subalutaceus]KAG1836505.1 P-loop containing nucleoside triphosphate hydrolase protein [Suillus subalutaceus]
MPGALLALSSPSHAEEPSFVDAPDEQFAVSTGRPQAGSIPWCWPAWQQRTGFSSPPFSSQVAEDTPSIWKSPEANQAVWTFISNFWAVEDSMQVDYIKKERPDNDTKGRELWLDFFRCKWADWKINSAVDAVLVERSLDPYSIMKRMRLANLPDLATSQVALAYPGLAEVLFGIDAFTEDGIALKEPVRRFLDTLITHHWARNRKTWLKDVEGLTKILTRYRDQESLQQLSEQQETLSNLLDGLGIDIKGGSKLRLPKPLRQALSFLATQQDITLLAASIQDQLKLCDPNTVPEDSIPEFDPDATNDCDFGWSEGVEEFKSMSEDNLWTVLGLPEKRIPFFNALQDPYGNCDPWTEDGQNWLKDPANGEPLALRWHQLVGLAKMVKNAFEGKPILLMDDVGLGKTIQVTALIALLAFYREFYTIHNCFPGRLAAKQWRNNDDSPNIPDLPIILVIPPNLISQFTSELHRFLQRGSFDILPYLATWNSRQSWWQDIWSRSIQPEGRRIIITTPKALESDFDRILEANNLYPSKSPRQKANYATDAPTTAYGHHFLLCSVDEAHNQRNIRKGYWAIFSLRERSLSMVAMTATPITSGPLVSDRISKIIIGTVKGNADIEVPSLYRSQMLTWINDIRKRFSGIVIRRTIWSVDNQGVRISGLAPFKEHNLLVELYDHEVDNLELIAKELVEEGGTRAAKFAAGSVPSRKLDVLAQVILWHQKHDNRQPLCVVDNKLVASSSDPGSITGIVDPIIPDKILVYCAFPSSYTQVTKVLELHGILTLQIYGKLSLSARTNIITKFKNSGPDGPRVLIISNIGLTDPELQDSLWSATDEGQLIGRIYRPPQSKAVHIYRIVAANTQDVFLNNISFSKAAILDAFTGATPSLRMYWLALLQFKN